MLMTELPFDVWIGVANKPMRCKCTGPPALKPIAWAENEVETIIDSVFIRVRVWLAYRLPRGMPDSVRRGRQTVARNNAWNIVCAPSPDAPQWNPPPKCPCIVWCENRNCCKNPMRTPCICPWTRSFAAKWNCAKIQRASVACRAMWRILLPFGISASACNPVWSFRRSHPAFRSDDLWRCRRCSSNFEPTYCPADAPVWVHCVVPPVRRTVAPILCARTWTPDDRVAVFASTDLARWNTYRHLRKMLSFDRQHHDSHALWPPDSPNRCIAWNYFDSVDRRGHAMRPKYTWVRLRCDSIPLYAANHSRSTDRNNCCCRYCCTLDRRSPATHPCDRQRAPPTVDGPEMDIFSPLCNFSSSARWYDWIRRVSFHSNRICFVERCDSVAVVDSSRPNGNWNRRPLDANSSIRISWLPIAVRLPVAYCNRCHLMHISNQRRPPDCTSPPLQCWTRARNSRRRPHFRCANRPIDWKSAKWNSAGEKRQRINILLVIWMNDAWQRILFWFFMVVGVERLTSGATLHIQCVRCGRIRSRIEWHEQQQQRKLNCHSVTESNSELRSLISKSLYT